MSSMGVVVRNYQDDLSMLRKQSNVYFARAGYAGGIIEGLDHFGLSWAYNQKVDDLPLPTLNEQLPGLALHEQKNRRA